MDFYAQSTQTMQSSKQYPLSKLVHADEFVVGACQQAKPERSYQNAKNKVVVAIELSEKQQVKRVYIKAIDDYSAQALTPII